MLTDTTRALARFRAAGHRLVRYSESGPYSWLKPGVDPPGKPPDRLDGAVTARHVSDLCTAGLAEGATCPLSSDPGSGTVRIVEATRTCVDTYSTHLN